MSVPRVLDLGELSGDVMLWGGAVSNLQATRALIAQSVARGVAAGNAICTGDLVAYCADPAATVALVRDWGCPVIAGNCERQLAVKADDCGCGFQDGSACDVLSDRWFAHSDSQIGPADRAWMGSLADFAVFAHGRRRYGVVHGGATAINRFLWPSSSDNDFQQEINALMGTTGPLDGIISGHSGIAFQRVVDGVHWINPGSVGMPPHDGRPETRYAVLSDDGVRFHRLSYDHGVAAQAMVAAGLTQGYDRTLQNGIWPSQDILPPELRR